MKKLLLIVFPLLMVLLAVSQTGAARVPAPADVQPQVLAACLEDYQATWGKRQAAVSEEVVQYELISQRDARRRVPRGEFPAREYLCVRISRLRPGEVGGAAYYIVDIPSGQILHRYHTR